MLRSMRPEAYVELMRQINGMLQYIEKVKIMTEVERDIRVVIIGLGLIGGSWHVLRVAGIYSV